MAVSGFLERTAVVAVRTDVMTSAATVLCWPVLTKAKLPPAVSRSDQVAAGIWLQVQSSATRYVKFSRTSMDSFEAVRTMTGMDSNA